MSISSSKIRRVRGPEEGCECIVEPCAERLNKIITAAIHIEKEGEMCFLQCSYLAGRFVRSKGHLYLVFAYAEIWAPSAKPRPWEAGRQVQKESENEQIRSRPPEVESPSLGSPACSTGNSSLLVLRSVPCFFISSLVRNTTSGPLSSMSAPTLCLYPRLCSGLVSGVDQVVRKSLDGLCRVTGLDVLGVVADEDGLFRLDNADAYPAL